MLFTMLSLSAIHPHNLPLPAHASALSPCLPVCSLQIWQKRQIAILGWTTCCALRKRPSPVDTSTWDKLRRERMNSRWDKKQRRKVQWGDDGWKEGRGRCRWMLSCGAHRRGMLAPCSLLLSISLVQSNPRLPSPHWETRTWLLALICLCNPL